MTTSQVVSWQDYREVASGARSVHGTLKVLDGLWSPQLDNRRDILVYLPPSHDLSHRRYPVLYMHDGQNLFDSAASYCGEWEVDETMDRLAAEGIEAIVVGIPNAGSDRLAEYSPFPDVRIGPYRADRYLQFVVETVKPLVDRSFRTLPAREHTGVMGSSMGGLISLYAGFHYADVFGVVGAMSPSLWVGRGAILRYVRRAPFTPAKIYLDAGTSEAGALSAQARRLKEMLIAKGYRDDKELRYVEEEGGIHSEGAWARRLPAALRFLLR